MALPMFPLGVVLFPYQVMPLHVFEERYRTMVKDVIDSDNEFGVVLIERGSDVGGADVRTDIGTIARIVQTEELDDGRWVMVAVGTRRVRVLDWLPDDPYPRAVVTDAEDVVSEDLASLAAQVARRLTKTSAMLAELGRPAPPLDIEFSDDIVARSHQMCAVAPLGELDRHRLLDLDSVGDRFRTLDEMLSFRIEILESELAAG